MAYIIVILIVAILNGCLPFIDQMIDGILPLSLYAEKYMSMVSGVQMFGKLYNIIFGFGVSLIVLKFLKKGFEAYVLWTDGDADEEPVALLTNFFKAMAVAVSFPTLYGWLADIITDMTTQLMAAIGDATSAGWEAWVVRRNCNSHICSYIYGGLLRSVFSIPYARFGNYDTPCRCSACLRRSYR